MDLGVSSSNGYMSHLANTTNTESTVNDSEFYASQFDFNKPQMSSSSQINESDVIDVGKVLKSRMPFTQRQLKIANYEFDENEVHVAPVDFKNKQPSYFEDTNEQIDCSSSLSNEKYIQFSNKKIQSEINKCYDADNGNSLSKKNQSLSLFWPKTVAECDTSYLEGSLVFTPSKKQQADQLESNDVPDILTCSSNSADRYTKHMGLKKSYNCNSGSSTSYSTSTSSLILNSNSSDQTMNNNFVQQKEALKFVHSENVVAVLTHTGSASSSDNESGNETHV